MFKFWNDLTAEKKAFYIFLIVHLVAWTLIGMIRKVLPTDALEGIYWGSLHDFGTPKHPPLAGWLTYLAFIPFKSDLCVYFISQLFIFFGFIYIYKLAKFFLDDNKAMLSVVILEGCWVYSYITCYYGFNPDVILLLFLPLICYIFYNCINKNRPVDWLLLGIIVGISFLNKYQTGLIILPLAVYSLVFKREVFKNIYLYLSIVLAFLIFLPHLLWLIKYDFYPLLYFEGELTAPTWINHLTASLYFLLMQLVVIIGTLLIFVALKLKCKSYFELAQNRNKADMWMILLLGFTPLVVHLLIGLFAGGTMRPRWGYEFWFMTGIVLFYFFPVNVTKKEFMFTLKLSYIVMLIIFVVIGTLLSVEKNYRSRYPVAHVFSDLKNIWAQNISTPVKYLGGYIEWTLPITIYDDTHPKCILDNHGYPDPWISQDELKKYGVLLINRKYDEIIQYTRMSCPYLDDDYKIEPVEYKFTLTNDLGQSREYTIYYVIVPPMN